MYTKITKEDIYIPTKESLKENVAFLEKCESLGIMVDAFSDIHAYSEDDLLAMYLLSRGEEVPEKLSERLKEQHKKDTPIVEKSTSLTEEELDELDKIAFEILGDKYKKNL